MKSAKTYNILALSFGLLALLTCWLWTYGINLVTALPCFLAAWFFCRKADKALPGNAFSKINYGLLVSVFMLSIVSLFLYR